MWANQRRKKKSRSRKPDAARIVNGTTLIIVINIVNIIVIESGFRQRNTNSVKVDIA